MKKRSEKEQIGKPLRRKAKKLTRGERERKRERERSREEGGGSKKIPRLEITLEMFEKLNRCKARPLLTLKDRGTAHPC